MDLIKRIERSLNKRSPETENIANEPKHSNRASVAIIIGTDEKILMIRRPEKKGDPWSGHMAFPGGREEQKDQSLKETAERETFEEVSLKLTSIANFLGKLDDMHHPKLSVSAYVYSLHSAANPIGNHEVAEIFWFPISELWDDKFRGTLKPKIKKSWCVVKDRVFETIQIGDSVIWGISLRFIDELKRKCTEEV